MATNPKDAAPFTTRLAASWRNFCDAYRRFNLKAHHIPGALLKLMVIGYFIFCACFLTVRYIVWPHIENYKVNIEQVASKSIGSPVSIAALRASWDGINPHLILDDVSVRDRNGRQVLSLPNVSATLSWWSILIFEPRFVQLEITRPELDIRREADGKIYIAGMLFDPGAGSDGKGADWVLAQQEIVITDGRLSWTDNLRKAPELALGNVRMVLQNHWRHHRFLLTATPPPSLAAPFDIRADFVHPFFSSTISDVRQWKGELFADLKKTDLTTWKAYFDYPFEIKQGYGSVRAWLTMDHAKVADFTADLSLSNVSTRLRKDLEQLDLAEVKGRISAREDFNPDEEQDASTLGTRGHAISLTDFTLRTKDGEVVPETTISESYTPGKNDIPGKTEITAKRLDLQVLANFVKYLPLTVEQRQMLADFSPGGHLKDFSIQWQGNYPELLSYHLDGEFIGLSLKAQAPRAARPASGKLPVQPAIPGIPGFENLTGRVDANDRGGNFTLGSDKLTLYFPGYFSEPAMLFDSMKMQAKWSFLPKDQFLFEINKLDFVQQGITGSLTGKHQMSFPRTGNALGTIDMTGKLSGFDVKKIGRYLPMQTPEGLRKWLTGALEDGIAQDAVIRIKGDLANFPFSDKRTGEFSVFTRIENGKLNYTPGKFAKDGKSPMWPQAEQIKGRLIINGARLEVIADTAQTNKVALSNVVAVVPDMMSKDMQLDIVGHADGPLQDFVRYTHVSPVAEWIGNFTEDTQASGNAKLLLKLGLPLTRIQEAKVQGTLQFANNDVTLLKSLPLLTNTNGKLEFYEKGFKLDNINTHFLGGTSTISGGTQPSGPFQVKSSGNITADGLRKAYPSMSSRISGNTRYSLAVNQKGKQPDIILESNLRGIALDFPAPLNKLANDAMPLKFQLTGLPAASGQLRDEIKASLGSSITARYLRQKAAAKSAGWRLTQGGIGVNTAASLPSSGLAVSISAKSLDLDTWQSVLSPIIGSSGQQKPSNELSDEAALAQYINPDFFNARALEFIVGGLKFNHVDLEAAHREGSWQADIKSDQALGRVTWNEAETKNGQGKVTARLKSLTIPQSASSEVSSLLAGSKSPKKMPALDITADDFEFHGKKLGHLELVAGNAPATSGGWNWNIDKLSVANPDGTLKTSGKWTATKNGTNTTQMSYALELVNAGKMLDRLGFPNLLRGGKGKLDGNLEWKGMPFSLDYPSLSGQVNLALGSGQFLKVEPGAAKLLGVLSLQNLPRRLTLDFRDVFSQGFAFDGINATASIANGVAKTDNLKMRGVSAVVLMEGSADVVHETQNLHVVVIPVVDMSAAAFVYGVAINPVIGVGAFLAQLILRDPLMKALTFEYQITGSWSDPTITKITKPGDASKAPPSATANVDKNKGE